MTIQECYEKMGGDYEQVEKRLPSAKLIQKFVIKFLDDGSYDELQEAMEKGQRETAFRAAHTLKGVCGNLSFSRLLDSASKLTEVLREENEEIPAEAVLMMEDVKKDYESTVEVIREYMNSAE
ncbi:MAG: Hpt domain-containing protein [Emergencia sp.]